MAAYQFPRICISSTRGGGGKTFLSLGLARVLANMGLAVKPFKKGPDYIDAAWLGAAARNEASNLDPFFQDKMEMRALFVQAMRTQNAAMALIEGNRGIYDGLDETGSCSTAQVARWLNCPVLLCLDVGKATRTVAAILKGILGFEENLAFAGVILNGVGSARHERAIRAAISRYVNLPVLGVLPRLAKNPLPERHMGLASQGAALGADVETRLEIIAAHVKAHANIDEICKAANAAPPLDAMEPAISQCQRSDEPRIGFARDEALWFYYPENIAALRQAGARPVALSLLDESRDNMSLWQNLDGLYLGGGFPEDCLEALRASRFPSLIRELADRGMPIYAECGGMMILCESLEKEGISHKMAGFFDARVIMSAKPRGLGYVLGTVAAPNPFYHVGYELRGHEFHYSSCEAADATPALRLSRGSGLNGKGLDGFVKKNVWASYTHIFAPAVPIWAANFTAAARIWARTRGDNAELIRV